MRTHPVTVDAGGSLHVTVSEPDPAELRPALLASLRRGIERDYVGQVSRDVVRLLRADTNPGELVWEAVAHGAPRADFGWGHSIASATDCLAMVDLFDGDQRALPIVQGIVGIAETERDRPVNALPDPASPISAAIRAASSAASSKPSSWHRRRRCCAARSTPAGRPTSCARGSPAVVSDHLLSYGHAAIYSQKAFQLLDVLGWERADTVLPHLVPTIVYGTREDTLPYMRPVHACARRARPERAAARPRSDVARRRHAARGHPRWWTRPGGACSPRPSPRCVSGAGVDGLLDVVVDAVSERMLRYDATGEFDFHDDFGWLDITHGLTYANAARWHGRHAMAGDVEARADAVRLALWCVFLAHWTGRHEWHTDGR